MRRMTYFVMALALVLGFTQCKKEQIEPQGGKVNITLNVENGGASTGSATDGAKVNVNENHVTFGNGDKILVAHDGKYVGTLTYTEYETGKYRFQGDIDADVAEPRQKLYFYFLGNKQDDASLDAGSTTSCTVNISDQTGYPALPVISFSASNEDFTGEGSYTASLHNKASLMKFNVTTPSNSPICITGMNNKVIVDFSKAANDGENNGFTYEKEGDGIIKLKGGSGSPAVKWAIVFPQDELAAGSAGSIYAQNGTYTTFTGSRPLIHAIEANGYYHEGGDVITMTVNTATEYVDLGDITANTTIATGKTVIGTLANNVKISIADGATVTLSGVTINGVDGYNYKWAGLDCLGDVTINLADGTTNTVKGFHKNYPGIQVPAGSTLTIQGTGALDASSNGKSAGIGSGFNSSCGNIVISGGTIAATGGQYAAGIGSGFSESSCGTVTISGGNVNATGGQSAAGIGSGYSSATCGAISINGGTVVATGGDNGAGIGTGYSSSSGAITISGGTVTATGNGRGAGIGTGYSGTCADGIAIANTVTSVTATKGGSATNSIGAGLSGTCGTVTIGGVVGAISTSPYTYPVPVPSGAINGKFTINGSGDQVYFSQGNLQYQASTGTWRFAEHQYDFIGGGNFLSESNTDWIDLYRWGTSGIDYTGHATLYRPWEWAYYSQYFNPYGSLTTNLYDGAGENAGKADWGYNAISNGGNTQNSGWRTLKNNTTDNEWQYIFNSRTTANEINSTSNARYTQARINIDDWAVRGIILFPDGSIGDTPSGVTWGTINAAASSWTTGTTQCTTAGWAALEAAGCVFLPASGKYDDSGVSQAEIEGYYWSSSYASDDNAYGMYFYSNGVNPQYSDARHYGLSVRLVKDAN